MAKEKRNQKTEAEETAAPRQNRREMLLKRKQAEQMRSFRLAAIVVLAIIALIIVAGLVVEFLIVPGQAVAQVGSETITIREWQQVVRFQRAQLIAGIEDQFQQFLPEDSENQEQAEQDALRFVQQFSGQQIALLTIGSEQLGEFVLEQMVEDKLVRQEAISRGISVTEAEVDALIGERYNFFDGESPTPFPTATTGPEPTPSITPLAAALAEETVADGPEATSEPLPTTPPLPSPTPLPTATPVSRESFEEELNTDLDNIEAAGGNAALFRVNFENAIYREKLAKALFAEREEPTRVPHASSYVLIYDSEEAAATAQGEISGVGFLEVWNGVRSQPPIDPAAVEPPPFAQATERLWLTQDQYGSTLPASVVEAIFSLPLDTPSDVITGADMQTGEARFYIIQVSGREDRDLDDFEISRRQQEVLSEWLNQVRIERVTQFENWRARVPRTPALEAFYRNPAPTITPPAPVIAPTIAPLPTAADGQ